MKKNVHSHRLPFERDADKPMSGHYQGMYWKTLERLSNFPVLGSQRGARAGTT